MTQWKNYNMRKFIKQFFCYHQSIMTNTEVFTNGILIIKIIVQCSDCEKTFPQHPNQDCCYVKHIIHECIREHLLKPYLGLLKRTETE